MNDRIYPKELLKEAIIDLQLDDLQAEINELKAQMGSISVEIAVKEIELKEICPHTRTKTICGEISGDYYNKGTYYTIKKCIICNEELSRKESPSSYG
jgi:hypothetical protein